MLFVLLFLYSCKTEQDYIVTQNQVDSSLINLLTKNLETAFDNKDSTLLDTFIINWSDRYDYKTKINDPIERDVYEIFKVVYTRANISKIEPSWENSDFIGDNIIIQSNVSFFVEGWNYDNIENDNWPTIFDLRVNISDSLNLLQLTPEYEIALRNFIGNKKRHEYNEELYFQIDDKRIDFLKSKLKIRYGGRSVVEGNDNCFWHIITHPKIHFIDFT